MRDLPRVGSILYRLWQAFKENRLALQCALAGLRRSGALLAFTASHHELELQLNALFLTTGRTARRTR